VTQGEDQTESRDSIEHACLESGWLARLALVNDNEQKLYNYLNAHGLGVYYTITTSHGMNHHYSTAGLSPSAIWQQQQANTALAPVPSAMGQASRTTVQSLPVAPAPTCCAGP
jgi:hypothetical protein